MENAHEIVNEAPHKEELPLATTVADSYNMTSQSTDLVRATLHEENRTMWRLPERIICCFHVAPQSDLWALRAC